MHTLKTRYPRTWCIIVSVICVIVIAVFWPLYYLYYFGINFKRILSNLWDDLRGIFSTPWRQTRREFLMPWPDIAKTWKTASK